MKLCNEEMFQYIYKLLECEKSSNGMKATAVYLINSLIHNNGMCVCVCVCVCIYVCMYVCMLVSQARPLYMQGHINLEMTSAHGIGLGSGTSLKIKLAL